MAYRDQNDAESFRRFEKWMDMDPKHAKFINKSEFGSCPGVQDLSRDCPDMIHFSPVGQICPGVQDLSSGCPRVEIIPEQIFCPDIMSYLFLCNEI